MSSITTNDHSFWGRFWRPFLKHLLLSRLMIWLAALYVVGFYVCEDSQLSLEERADRFLRMGLASAVLTVMALLYAVIGGCFEAWNE
jgi:hypothetical protein